MEALRDKKEIIFYLASTHMPHKQFQQFTANQSLFLIWHNLWNMGHFFHKDCIDEQCLTTEHCSTDAMTWDPPRPQSHCKAESVKSLITRLSLWDTNSSQIDACPQIGQRRVCWSTNCNQNLQLNKTMTPKEPKDNQNIVWKSDFGLCLGTN